MKLNKKLIARFNPSLDGYFVKFSFRIENKKKVNEAGMSVLMFI